jgi:hypothetical protein
VFSISGTVAAAFAVSGLHSWTVRFDLPEPILPGQLKLHEWPKTHGSPCADRRLFDLTIRDLPVSR